MVLRLLESPDMPPLIKPSIAWPDDAAGRAHRILAERLLTDDRLPDSAKPVSPDYDPDKLVSMNIRVPPALHEILCLWTWEFRVSLSDVCRALLWQHVDPSEYIPVFTDDQDNTTNVPYKKVKK